MLRLRNFLLVVLFLSAAVFCILLYEKWGGKYYYQALQVLERASGDKKAQSEQIFNSTDKYMYSGIYMGSFAKYAPGVWVWGNKGPRFFRSDEYTVYSHFRVCTSEGLESIKSGRRYDPVRNIQTDIGKWSKVVNAGNYIAVRVAGPENGGNLGRLREAWAYDWWVFSPDLAIDKQCEK